MIRALARDIHRGRCWGCEANSAVSVLTATSKQAGSSAEPQLVGLVFGSTRLNRPDASALSPIRGAARGIYPSLD